jgi:hypothetical protein
MRRWALCFVAMFGCALVTQSQVLAASGGLQSGARVGGTRGGASGTRGAAPRGLPRGGLARPAFPGTGLAGRGFPGRFGAGRLGAGDGRFGRFGEGRFGRFGGGFVAGVPAFVPLPDLLGLPYYDGFEYPYFFPDTSGPYVDEIYGFPQTYLPPPAGYGLPPQTDYLPSPDGAAGAVGPQVWYYCQDPMGYYPYVRDCSTNWQAVPASVLPPPTPQ